MHKLLCPKCSKIVELSSNRLFCKACHFEYFHNVAAASVAILENNNSILLLKRANKPKKGRIHLPGGLISTKETAEMALIREIKEELNLSINSINYLFSEPNKYRYSGITYSIIDLYFKISVSDIDKIQINHESLDYSWHTKSSLIRDQIAFTSVANALQKLGYIK